MIELRHVRFAMFGHYLTIALRNIKRAPLTALINVLTLALGLVSFVAAYAVVGYWSRSELHFANADRTYVITANLSLRDGSVATGTMPATNELYERYLRVEFPEFEAIAKANLWSREASITVDGRGSRVAAVAVDPEFLDIFDLPFLEGDPRTALDDPNGVLLTERAALRLFGTTEALGRTVTLGGNLIDATVTGVLAPIPEPSHMGESATASLRFDLMATYDLYRRLLDAVSQRFTPPAPRDADERAEGGTGAADGAAPETPPAEEQENWFGGYCCTTYVMLKRDSRLTRADLDERLAAFVERRVPAEALSAVSLEVGVVPLSGLMVAGLDAQLLGAASGGGLSITTLLFGLGALVLGVACVNYANLATARSARRAREIGLRKVLGAARSQIVAQHLLEAGLSSAAALGIAVLAVQLLAPAIREAVGIDVRIALFAGAGFWIFIAALLAGVTLLGGSYPALVLSRVRPIEALRLGRVRVGPRFASTVLVGAQFAAASLLVIAVIVMYAQNMELRRTGLGATRDPYLVINNFSPVTGVDNGLLREELERLPQVKGVTQMSATPWSDSINVTVLVPSQEGGAATRTAFWNIVGYDFFSTFDIPVVAGRVFDRDRNDLLPEDADLSVPRHVVIDRPYAAQLGFASPEEAVDAVVYEPRQFGPSRPVRIIGVVESRPLFLRGIGTTGNAYSLAVESTMFNQIVRLSAADVSGGIAAVEDVWRRLAPTSPLTRRFMDEMFEENYRNFARINQAFAGLAAFAIAISVIGLFGMAVHAASRRLHEIGVRKSLGAKNREIVAMLLRDFAKPVVAANLLAWPLAFVAAQAYLSIFIRRIDLTAVPFLLSLAFVVAVAWAAVASQALRASRVQPATVLRFE